MTILFAGGEDHDFAKIGTAVVDTALAAARRTANARCSLRVGLASTTFASTDGWQATLPSAATSFWLTGRFYFASGGYAATIDLLPFLDGTIRRLILVNDGSGHLRLIKQTAAGGRTTLATSTQVLSAITLYKLDIQVSNYGAAATINVYLDNVLWVTYTGDVTTDGSTSLSGFVLGPMSSNQLTYWSEVIVATVDTRALSLVTLPPAANGNAFAWTNSYANIDEVTLDDADLCASSGANSLLQTTVTSSGLTGTPGIVALCVSARAQKGGTGPQNISMAVRTGGNDYFSSSIALPAAFNRVANVFETNPATSGAWAYTDLTAAGFNIGVKSLA